MSPENAAAAKTNAGDEARLEARAPHAIAACLLDWFDQHGRHDLPWQHPRSAYRVWVAEIMLQQTQVATVIDYFNAFVGRFPDVATLAASDADTVMRYWAGLGYYARARNLHAAAKRVVADHGGTLPRDFDALMALPGIGRSTAGAIVAQAYGDWAPILDGNAKRVLARLAAIRDRPGTSRYDNQLWALARTYTPATRITDYTQAIMDLGATVCARARPRCCDCPLQTTCLAYQYDAQDSIPAPRKKKTRPVRHTRMLIISNAQGRVLLEKRPPAGIWGGLWSLPQIDTTQDVESVGREQYGLDIVGRDDYAPVHHAFTHFELRIEVTHLHVAGTRRIMEDESGWFERTDLPGVPAAVARLLEARQLKFSI